MKIIIEDYPYESEEAKEVLKQLGFQYESDGAKTLDLVGYHYSQALSDTVFFLPKVVINEKGLVFNHYNPEKLVEITRAREENYISENDFQFIYGLSVWIYRAISEFRQQLTKNKDASRIILSRSVPSEGLAGEYVNNTHLDIMLSLIRFNNENQDYFTFIVKNIHSGLNKINWTKTINHSGAFIQNGSPIYTHLINKRKQINYEEELFIIFFSILQHLHDKYGFPVSINIGYELLNEDIMETYLDGMGTLRLEQIRYKYFSDKELFLWQLCYDFFAMQSHIQAQDKQDDYLLVKNFNIVFEAMIDRLLSDDHDKIVEQLNLKEQEDGKRVDHIYSYDGLIYNEVKGETGQIYYIGDSKYYKIGNKLGKESVYKQYTYARNVIQANLNLFNEDKGTPGEDYLIYRDDVTEGYNITPNFFISADLPTSNNGKVSFDYGDKKLKLLVDRDYKPNIHFRNRMFDRDTLLLQHYNVNFLYILATYGSGDDVEQMAFRKYARKTFRDSIIDKLQKDYQFFSLQMKPDAIIPPADAEEQRDDMDRLVDYKYFRKLLGKAFRPFANKQFLYLSLEGKVEFFDDNMKLLTQLSNDFLIRSYKLGTNPIDSINQFTELVYGTATVGHCANNVYRFEDFKEEVFLIGGYRSDKHQMEWIEKHSMYNVRANVMRHGGIIIDQNAVSARFLILYDIADKTHSSYRVFLLNGHLKHVYEEQMRDELEYENPNGSYYVYGIGKEVYFEQAALQTMLNIGAVKAMSRTPHDEGWNLTEECDFSVLNGSPLYLKGEIIKDNALPQCIEKGKAIVVVDINDKNLSDMSIGYAAGMFVSPTMEVVVKDFSSASYMVYSNKKSHKVFRIVGAPMLTDTIPKGFKERKYGAPLRSVLTSDEISKRIPDFYLVFNLEEAEGIEIGQKELNKVPDGMSGYDTRVIEI